MQSAYLVNTIQKCRGTLEERLEERFREYFIPKSEIITHKKITLSKY